MEAPFQSRLRREWIPTFTSTDRPLKRAVAYLEIHYYDEQRIFEKQFHIFTLKVTELNQLQKLHNFNKLPFLNRLWPKYCSIPVS